MSLGSIAHIQHYFARTGLLDGKGAQLARKNKLAKPSTLDLSSLVSAHSGPKIVGSDVESSYASTGGSPELGPQQLSGEVIVESPITEENGSYFSDDYDDDGFDFLPPTVSTFQAKEEIVEKPPTIDELNADLTNALRAAEAALAAVRSGSDKDNAPKETQQDIQGWYELQGVHILDVMTLAIRAAKLYYTAHEQPDRLDAIKSEKELRADLLAVMDVLKRMASRNFAGGVADDELQAMDAWIAGVVDLLRREDEIVAAERVERAAWTWMRGGDSEWAGREVEREYLFLQTLVRCIHQQPQQPHQQQADAVAAVEAGAALPAWTPITDTTELPTPFLSAMQSGVLLVRLHNTAVRKSRRRFGAIGTFNTDTAKPYRAADNLRFWAKAAELRWEVMLKIDPLAIVYGSRREAWIEFDAAILKWCRKVREEITADYAVECVS